MKQWFLIGVMLALLLTACSEQIPEPACCEALTAECLACQEGVAVMEYCMNNPQTPGCIPAEETQENTEQAEEFIPEVPDEQAVIEPEQNEEIAEEYAIPTRPLTKVSCEEDALTFTITNTLEKTMSLNLLSFPTPKDKTQLKISVNGYDPWNPERYFAESSLRDCLPAELEPQSSYTCTLKPIPIVKENAYSQNTVQVQAERINVQETFTC